MSASNTSPATVPRSESPESAIDLPLAPTSPLWAAFEAASDVMVWIRVLPGPTFRVVAANPACLRLAQAIGGAISVPDLGLS